MTDLCVFCGSGTGKNPIYRSAAVALAKQLLQRNIGLIYGGTRMGTMGLIADAMLAEGGRVTGIIPQTLYDRQLAHPELSELQVLPMVNDCKAAMSKLADGFCAMPGGYGTLDELFELLTQAQLGLHSKACGLLNTHGFFDQLLLFLSHARDEQFILENNYALLHVADTPEQLLNSLNL